LKERTMAQESKKTNKTLRAKRHKPKRKRGNVCKPITETCSPARARRKEEFRLKNERRKEARVSEQGRRLRRLNGGAFGSGPVYPKNATPQEATAIERLFDLMRGT